MATHTPGPWMIVQDDDDFNHYTVVTEQVGIADICFGGPKARRNAELIAAAPELLEALQNIKANLTGRDCLRERIEDSLRRAKEAIAKAEGREGDENE